MAQVVLGGGLSAALAQRKRVAAERKRRGAGENFAFLTQQVAKS
jgi:hypothetical protein